MQGIDLFRNNRIWIEITNQKGFLMFGDLSRHQKERGTNISSSEVDIVCDNCPHKMRFEKREKIWDWGKWRVFLRGNQISKGEIGYYSKLRIEFYCSHCQGDLPQVGY